MAKKPPYGNSPGPKTPYAQDSPPLIINRNQRRQLEAIDGPMESVGSTLKRPPAAPRPTPRLAPVAPRPQPRQPTDWSKLEAEAEAEKKRKRPLR